MQQSGSETTLRIGSLPLFVAVLLLAALLRLFDLQQMPPGLARDEALNADIAEGILAGRLALFFREGYGHEPLYHYIGALFQAALGDNFLAIRLPSVFLGLLLVALLTGWTWREFGRRPAIVAALLVAVSWWPLIFSRIGLRPVLLPTLLLLSASAWPRRPIVAGFWLGVAMYSYTAAPAALLLPPAFALFLFGFGKPVAGDSDAEPDPWRRRRTPLIVTAVALLTALPLYWTLWRDPSLITRVGQLAGPLAAAQSGDWQPLLANVWRTLTVFSVTGDPLSSYALPNRPLLLWPIAMLFHWGVLVAVVRSRQRPVYAFALLWLLLLLAPSIAAQDAPSLIRLIGALPVVYLMAAVGAEWLLARLPQQRALTAAALSGLLLLTLSDSWRNGFQTWNDSFATRVKYQSIWLDISQDIGNRQNVVVADGWYEPVKADSLRRDLGRPLAARWVQQGGALVLPQAGADLYVPEFAPLDPALLQRAGVSEPQLRSTTSPAYARYRLLPTAPQRPLTTFGAALSLLDYSWLDENRLLTEWRVEAPLPADLQLFVHLYAGETLFAQDDGLDAAAETLQPGDVFYQLHRFERPGQTPLTVHAGAYELHSGARLMQPQPPFDHIVLEDW